MKRWDQRPFEIRNLFNPAFCGLVLFRALNGYEEEDDRGMPFSLSLLVLPLCLHKDSRELIARSPRSYLLKTAEKNQQIMVGFADRITQMLPHAFEGFGVLMERGCIIVGEGGRSGPYPRRCGRPSMEPPKLFLARRWRGSLAENLLASPTERPFTRRSGFVHEDQINPYLQP